MIFVRSLAVFLVLVHLVEPGEGNEKVYDTYFNGFCYWSEEVSYHVQYSSGCKVYFTCQRGKFLDFHKCPESTVFSTETLRCEVNGICKNYTNVNPNYQVWWNKVVGVIDEVLEALDKSSTLNQKLTVSTSTEQVKVSTVPDASPTAFLSSTIPPQTLLMTKHPLVESIGSSDKDIPSSVDTENNRNVRGSVSMPTVIESTSVSTKLVAIEPSSSTANTPETKPLSVHIIPMQFDTQTSLLTESSSSVMPKTSVQGDILKIVDQSNLPYLGSITSSSNSTKEHNFLNDFLLPLFQDILKNSKIMSKVSHLFMVVFENADPLLYQILDQQVDDKLDSTIIFSLKDLKEAWNRSTFLARPIIREILRALFPIFFRRAAESNEVLLDFMDSKDFKLFDNLPSIFGTLLDLSFKYRLLDKTSPSDSLKTYSLIEIRKDIKDVTDIFSNVFGVKLNLF